MDQERPIFKAIGLMSGTSLDGIDLAFCTFEKSDDGWHHELLIGETIPYCTEERNWLTSISSLSHGDLLKGHMKYGHRLGVTVREFCNKHQLVPDLVASHGHTIFHQPHRGFTFQLGHGPSIANGCQTMVVSNFRSQDVALGGQGAPLVPIGDQLLFGKYDCCLNLGGFANISFNQQGERVAYDICPVNIVMNALAAKLGANYDAEGQWAASGQIDQSLLQGLNNLDFYTLKPPRSLGREWVEEMVAPLIETSTASIEDQLHTICEHVAIQIGNNISHHSNQVLVTGGGAYNTYLMARIGHYSKAHIHVPDSLLTNFKEALTFAFLGVLKVSGLNNTLASVTGASRDHCSGFISRP